MLNDRGKSKKWRGFFMPEHIAMLKKAEEDYYKVPRPELTEDQIEEIEQFIISSLQSNHLLEIKTWKNGFFTTRGSVRKMRIYNVKHFDTSLMRNYEVLI